MEVAVQFSGSFWRNGAVGLVGKGTLEAVSQGHVIVVTGQRKLSLLLQILAFLVILSIWTVIGDFLSAHFGGKDALPIVSFLLLLVFGPPRFFWAAFTTDFLCRKHQRLEFSTDALTNIRQQGVIVNFVIQDIGNLRVKFPNADARDQFFDAVGLRVEQPDSA